MTAATASACRCDNQMEPKPNRNGTVYLVCEHCDKHCPIRNCARCRRAGVEKDKPNGKAKRRQAKTPEEES